MNGEARQDSVRSFSSALEECMSESPRPSRPIAVAIVALVCFNFASYVCNGLPLAVLPGYVLKELDFSSVLVGVVIGTQYIVSLLSRPLAGNVADRFGAKTAVLCGLTGLVVTGGLTGLAVLLSNAPALSLCLLLAARAVQGASAALISTPCCTWAIGLHGTSQATRVMSWNGIASYGGTAVGAPVGVLVHQHFGMAGIGLSMAVLGLTALGYALTKQAAPLVPGKRLPFGNIFFSVLPNGLALACSSVGFGSLTAFVALYFDRLGWANAAYCLTGFGIAFIVARLSTPNVVPRFGGYRVVSACMAIQTVGLLLIWLAPVPAVAVLGAMLTGLGVSWVYPGLGVETLARTPEASRTSALSTLSLFFDLAVGMAGPLMGLVATGLGFPSVFLVSAMLSSLGLICVLRMHRRHLHERSLPPAQTANRPAA